jgi:hypothetical protein
MMRMMRMKRASSRTPSNDAGAGGIASHALSVAAPSPVAQRDGRKTGLLPPVVGDRGVRSCRAGSVHPAKHAPRDDLRLDFRRAFEDREHAGIAEHAADRVFHRIAVAAMDLQRGIGI